jgi:hypothetical protein
LYDLPVVKPQTPSHLHVERSHTNRAPGHLTNEREPFDGKGVRRSASARTPLEHGRCLAQVLVAGCAPGWFEGAYGCGLLLVAPKTAIAGAKAETRANALRQSR